MKKYKALFIDLCDTLVPFNNQRIPEVKLGGVAVRSTSPVVYEVFSRRRADVTFETFHRCFSDCYDEIMAIREREQVEIPSPERFRRVLDRLKVPRDNGFEALVEEIVSTHMTQMQKCLETAPEHRALLDRLRRGHRLALVSNFDYTPTVHAVLKRDGIFDHFETIVVSADVGLRKPHPELFLSPCRTLGLTPRDVLFVGDSLTLDVVGAKGVGMDVAWLNEEGAPIPLLCRPDYVLARLSDLEGILNA
jgi:HAD superfamily hydrolase (TIGR01549 family)